MNHIAFVDDPGVPKPLRGAPEMMTPDRGIMSPRARMGAGGVFQVASPPLDKSEASPSPYRMGHKTKQVKHRLWAQDPRHGAETGFAAAKYQLNQRFRVQTARVAPFSTDLCLQLEEIFIEIQNLAIRLQFLSATLYEGSNYYKYLRLGKSFFHVDSPYYSIQMWSTV